MLALVISEGALELTERPTPEPGARDVTVAVRAAGLNAADLLQRQGLYPAPTGWPDDVPGLEMAGVVSAVGRDADAALLGRRVCAIVGGGAQATHCLVPSEHLVLVPDGVSWDEAGGFAEAFATAHDALVSQARTVRGDRVLISGAAGGVGVAAVQIAHTLGAHVTAVTRTADHQSQLANLGADATVTPDELSAIERVDVVIELVGASNLTLVQRRLRPGARVVVIGVSGGGSVAEIDLLAFMAQRASLCGSTLRSRSRDEKTGVISSLSHDLVPLWNSGALRVPIARAFDLADASSAYSYFAQPGKFGKVVLRVDQ